MIKCRSAAQEVFVTLAAATLLTIILPNLARAQAAKDEHKLTLRAIMQELGTEYLRLTNALMIEDFKGLEESAKVIQSHPLPNEIVVAIKNKLGSKFRAFELADEQSHRGASDLVKRAAAKDIHIRISKGIRRHDERLCELPQAVPCNAQKLVRLTFEVAAMAAGECSQDDSENN